MYSMQVVSRVLLGSKVPTRSLLSMRPICGSTMLSPHQPKCFPFAIMSFSSSSSSSSKGFHTSAQSLYAERKPELSTEANPPATSAVPSSVQQQHVQPDASIPIKLPMYDMPMSKQVRHLRMVFLVNVFCSTAISLWVRLDDVYTVLAAGGIMTAGFIPLVLVQLMYRDHIRSIRILGNLSKKALQQVRRAEASGESQIEFPVTNDTPLLIEKFSLTGSDPKTPVYVRDLRPGPSRKHSVQWVYRPEFGLPTRFRISKKVIQFHPDVRALDTLIRENAELGITGETSVKRAKKLRKKMLGRNEQEDK
ncbi:hypothetical protein BX661DRAFT_179742 [Kickxella alabastrina]|nr:uncharacterized protein BX661DRAFT_179742 [Kickxella alabastrina]KAI7832069.1 hypothetical protein BX661DRAFT_179742 [Kickxella alabastrina]